MNKYLVWSFLKGIIYTHIFIIILFLALSINISESYQNNISRSINTDFNLLFNKINIKQSQAELLFQESNYLLSGKEYTYEQNEMFQAKKLVLENIQVLASISNVNDNNDESIAETIADNTELDEKENGIAMAELQVEGLQEYKVLLYCTHSAESYIPDSGKTMLDGKMGLVNDVAKGMAEQLKNKGLSTIFIEEIHDYPDYNRSYTRSRESLLKQLSENDDFIAVFDIHRDSIPGQDTAKTVNINGKKSAQILIILGTDERRPHPEWRKNASFAQSLYKKAEEMYPGLMKGIRSRPGTYNQEYHPGSLLLEMGTEFNTYQEALYAGELFSEILLEVLKNEFIEEN